MLPNVYLYFLMAPEESIVHTSCRIFFYLKRRNKRFLSFGKLNIFQSSIAKYPSRTPSPLHFKSFPTCIYILTDYITFHKNYVIKFNQNYPVCLSYLVTVILSNISK